MAIAKRKAKDTKPSSELEVEEGVRPADLVDVVMNSPVGELALSDRQRLTPKAKGLEAKALQLENAISQATNMARNMVSGAIVDMTRIEQDVIALATGNLKTDELVTKYGMQTNADAAAARATLEQVCNAIGTQILEVETQTKGLKLEKAKLLRVKASFDVIGTVAEVVDEADNALYKHEVSALNHEGRQDDLNYRGDRNELVRDNNQKDVTFRKDMNALVESDRQDRLAHQQSVNDLLKNAREVTRGILEAKTAKRKLNLNALIKANNGGAVS